MGRHSLQASSQGIATLKKAIKRKKGGQTYLAGVAGCSRQTIWSLLQGNPTDCGVFMALCNELGLNWEEIALPETLEPDADPAIDALVEYVQQKVYTNIQERCSTMRVLDMTRPIELDTIYTDVNILQEITGRRRLNLSELLEHCTLEEFDQLGFAHSHIKRRSGLEVVEEFNKLMLLGKPGAGKTTFLKRLATLCNKGNFQSHRVPIFITLKDFGDSSEKLSLLIYINQWLKKLGVQDSQSAEQILNHGRGLLLLDGLDEVSEKSSKQVLQEIQSFSEQFPQNAFVVSCRIAAKEFTFQQFTEVEVADFSDKQITDFADRWFQAKQLGEKTKNFLAKLKGQPRIKELATNPLLLTLLCLVFEGRTDFPVNRSELYEEGLDVLLKKWDGTRSIEREQIYRELSLKRKEDLLSQLAFATFEPGNYFFKQKEAECLIESYIQNLPGAQSAPEALRLDSEAVLKSIEAQHGLLVERARGIYSFSHLTFHEYFAAYRIKEKFSNALQQVLIPHLTERRWQEVFLLVLGMMESADSLLLMMKEQVDHLLGSDDRLQQFLTWVVKKSTSVEAPYKPAAIRAFYFDLGLASNEYFDFALGQVLDPAFAHDHDIDLAFDRGVTSSDNNDHNHDLTLTRILYYACVLDHTYDQSFAFYLVLTLNCKFDRSHGEDLRALKRQLPEPGEDWEHFQQWWQDNGSGWIEQLRGVMIEHRNIGHDWQFSDIQKQQLQQYYNANKLLVDCLNSDCYVSRQVREEIEGSLLLPAPRQQ